MFSVGVRLSSWAERVYAAVVVVVDLPTHGVSVMVCKRSSSRHGAPYDSMYMALKHDGDPTLLISVVCYDYPLWVVSQHPIMNQNSAVATRTAPSSDSCEHD